VAAHEYIKRTFVGGYVTNMTATIDVYAGPDGTAGASATYDLLQIDGQNAQFLSLNLHEGTGTNEYLQAELSPGTSGGRVVVLPRHWYRCGLLYTNGGGGIIVYDLENSLAVVGSSYTNGNTSSGSAAIDFRFGQNGHAGTSYACTSLFDNITIRTNGNWPINPLP